MTLLSQHQPNLGLSQSSTSSLADRFIPQVDKERWKMDVSEADYGRRVAEVMHGNSAESEDRNNRILSYDVKAPAPLLNRADEEKVICTVKTASQVKQSTRVIPTKPIHTLDAPNMNDEYYYNVVDWSQKNSVAVGLGDTVYLWDGETTKTDELMSLPDDEKITSVRWSNNGDFLAIGTSTALTQIWDVNPTNPRHLRTFRDHTRDVNAHCWNSNLLTTGSSDREIHYHDTRVKTHLVARFENHREKVCRLEWSGDGKALATGANDNKAFVIDARRLSVPMLTLDKHCGAVKALAWCPWQTHLLATGAGIHDKCIRFWNTAQGKLMHKEDTGSQVTGLHWSSSRERELLSSHGYGDTQLCLWKYPTMKKLGDLGAHSSRVLSIVPSPDGAVILAACADQTIKFWRVFEKEKVSSESRIKSGMSAFAKCIR